MLYSLTRPAPQSGAAEENRSQIEARAAGRSTLWFVVFSSNVKNMLCWFVSRGSTIEEFGPKKVQGAATQQNRFGRWTVSGGVGPWGGFAREKNNTRIKKSWNENSETRFMKQETWNMKHETWNCMNHEPRNDETTKNNKCDLNIWDWFCGACALAPVRPKTNKFQTTWIGFAVRTFASTIDNPNNLQIMRMFPMFGLTPDGIEQAILEMNRRRKFGK